MATKPTSMKKVWRKQILSSLSGMNIDVDDIFATLEECPELGDDGVAEKLVRIKNEVDVLQARFSRRLTEMSENGD